MTVKNCHFCGKAPTIKHSHVVPNFAGKYLKANSPFGYMLNGWKREKQFDIYKGPYLCAKFDNEVFSSWERHFAKSLWQKPFGEPSVWGDERTILFVLSLAYRYCLHFIATSPIEANKPYSEKMRDLFKGAMLDPAQVGQSVFVYPYVHQPIADQCGLLPGVNHLLQLAVHGMSLPSEDGLPDSLLVLLPGFVFLLCSGELRPRGGACEIVNPVSLKLNASLDASRSNIEMPLFLRQLFNRMVGESQGHQKQLGLWHRLAYGADKMLNPGRRCYLAQSQDHKLLFWQRENCS
jgi:hypothetical protein